MYLKGNYAFAMLLAGVSFLAIFISSRVA